MDSTAIIGTKTKKGQVITDPHVMMNKAPRTPSFFTGSEVIKEAVKRANVDVMVAYPITPQSEAAALCGELFAEGYIRDYFRGESEFAVMSQCAGAAFGGARVFTTTGPAPCGPWRTSRCGPDPDCRFSASSPAEASILPCRSNRTRWRSPI
jgi:pyruvate ferredoxin oxidoreductase alpha subunit